MTAALLFVGLAATFAFTRSHWLDDWDSVNFAFALGALVLSHRWSCENSAFAALDWIKTNRPAAILYSDSLQRHASFYWPEGETNPEPKSETECDKFRSIVESGRLMLSTNANLCGLSGTKVASFKRDARIHDKHHIEFIFEFGKSDASRVETPAGNN